MKVPAVIHLEIHHLDRDAPSDSQHDPPDEDQEKIGTNFANKIRNSETGQNYCSYFFLREIVLFLCLTESDDFNMTIFQENFLLPFISKCVTILWRFIKSQEVSLKFVNVRKK